MNSLVALGRIEGVNGEWRVNAFAKPGEEDRAWRVATLVAEALRTGRQPLEELRQAGARRAHQ